MGWIEIANIGRHAYDGNCDLLWVDDAEDYLPAERVPIRTVTAHEGFTDDARGRHGRLRILHTEISPPAHRDGHQQEVAGGHNAHLRDGEAAGFRRRNTFEQEARAIQ